MPKYSECKNCKFGPYFSPLCDACDDCVSDEEGDMVVFYEDEEEDD